MVYSLTMKELVFNKQRGFTIIEVVLVLAIAGLIFLTVFLAVPAMQKSQRDNARRQDVGRVVAALQQYKADVGGQAWYTYSGATYISYFSNLAQATYVYIRPLAEGCINVGGMDVIAVVPGCKCSQLGTGATPVANASFAGVQIRLENDVRYCKDV